ncbi:type IV toxin-antitoxin system AbiEi family antitoxin domain-containing protein [Gilvimarinus xylanilyticus]|uniref:Type IV toxin-antitoxin system AbiEi family antitoxin n=1 Tax=Gilvimarinus xylanilyticus TaxID=2944139 RepID=A0A9X2I2L2_9GAMM|nr:type IV toxin-antitoxin system AbiEi family antitoxin [Gilvimarinus xylanilyticus]MCP8900946.1 type IV toxin-antitoxin system AbiEi family antitoxin [Gilvimarinus xylanilyticus]
MTKPHPNLSEWLPLGQLATRQWLLERGVSRHSLDNALKSGKLVAVARGVVARPEIPLGWQGVVASLDRILPSAVYVGGLSALNQHGLGHYVNFDSQMHLYSAAAQPSWLPKLKLNVELFWHSTVRLWDERGLQMAKSLREQTAEAGWSWRLASPEQAFFEMLAGVPSEVSFEHADNLMQGLSSLSPRRLDALLRACRHVQVKRLFFFFADRHQYPWRKHLSAESYDLGVGKRSIVPGGKLDQTYLITVPESFHGSE